MPRYSCGVLQDVPVGGCEAVPRLHGARPATAFRLCGLLRLRALRRTHRRRRLGLNAWPHMILQVSLQSTVFERASSHSVGNYALTAREVRT